MTPFLSLMTFVVWTMNGYSQIILIGGTYSLNASDRRLQSTVGMKVVNLWKKHWIYSVLSVECLSLRGLTFWYQWTWFVVGIVWCAKIITFKALMALYVTKVGITCVTKINRSIYILPIINGFLSRKCISFVDFTLSRGVCAISSCLIFFVAGNTNTFRSALPWSTAFTWFFAWWHL